MKTMLIAWAALAWLVVGVFAWALNQIIHTLNLIFGG